MVRRRLDAELVRRHLAPSRQQAQDLIREGLVTVGGLPADKPSRQVDGSEALAIKASPEPFVSRAGRKLQLGLERFQIDPTGLTALDAGASTGGFTDCLLQARAAHVHAVDVGHDQLAWSIRNDPRVTVYEHCNVRHLTPDDLGGTVGISVCDVSFISLTTVGPAIASCMSSGASGVWLIKPQFEAGPARVGKGGIISDPAIHVEVINEVTTRLADLGITIVDVAGSPIRGAKGNTEFLAHIRLDGDARMITPAQIASVVKDAHTPG